jgi:trans-2,3-dihydro-3-hydroxyanthranilate isomerase
MNYTHVDVFGTAPYQGNSLSVVHHASSLTSMQQLAITRELKHFETIFLESLEKPSQFRAHIFDHFEELDFAGHPLLGAAAALHHQHPERHEAQWNFVLNRKNIQVVTRKQRTGYEATMLQGTPEFGGVVPSQFVAPLCAALNLRSDNLHEKLPLEVVSLGLPYVIIPLRSGLETARLRHEDFGAFLRRFGAQFAYLFDVEKNDGRTWNNDGVLEDVATGSAAGAVGAYLTKHAQLQPNEAYRLRQGRFLGRPSELNVIAFGTPHDITDVSVSGQAFVIGHGVLEVLP